MVAEVNIGPTRLSKHADIVLRVWAPSVVFRVEDGWLEVKSDLLSVWPC